MKVYQIFLATVLMIAAISCGPDEVEGGGDLQLQFSAEFAGAPFYINQEYAFADGRKVRFSQVDFYVADILINEVSNDVNKTSDLSEVAFINLSSSEINPTDPQEAQINVLNIPVGNYTNLGFTLGLTDELNLKTPSDSDIGSTNPLSKASHYWEDWGSYIFMKIQGSADFDDNGTIDPEETFIYHTGKSGNEKRVSLNGAIDITEDDLTKAEVSLDVSTIFYDATGAARFDMSADRSVHNENGLSTIDVVMEGTAESIKMK